MEYKHIEKLLESFYNGNTTVEEEDVLKKFFHSENVPEYLEIDQSVFISLHKEKQTIPHNLEFMLSKAIDKFPVKEQKEKTLKNRRIYFYLMGVASAIIICIALFVPKPTNSQLADTFTDPKEAAIVAQQALILLSSNLNEGIEQVENVQKQMKAINNILEIHIEFQEITTQNKF